MKFFLWFAIININISFGIGALLFWIDCEALQKAWNPLTKGVCWDVSVHIISAFVVSGTCTAIYGYGSAGISWD